MVDRCTPVFMGIGRTGVEVIPPVADLMAAAMQDFCDKVDRGEARSRATYTEFKRLLALYEATR